MAFSRLCFQAFGGTISYGALSTVAAIVTWLAGGQGTSFYAYAVIIALLCGVGATVSLLAGATALVVEKLFGWDDD
jgi:hypothetical protein